MFHSPLNPPFWGAPKPFSIQSPPILGNLGGSTATHFDFSDILLDWKIQELIENREKTGGFAFWVQYGQPPSTRTIERWLKPIEERHYWAKTSRSPGWHSSAGGVLRTRDGRELRYEHSNDVWQIDHTKADILLVDEDGEEIGQV